MQRQWQQTQSQPRPQYTHVGGEHRAGGLKADRAVVDGFGAGGESPQIGEVAGIGEVEGLGKDVRHNIDSTGCASLGRRRSDV